MSSDESQPHSEDSLEALPPAEEAKLGLEIGALEHGDHPADELHRRAEAGGYHIASDGTERPTRLGRLVLGVIERFAKRKRY
jgi:hypothetical protein